MFKSVPMIAAIVGKSPPSNNQDSILVIWNGWKVSVSNIFGVYKCFKTYFSWRWCKCSTVRSFIAANPFWLWRPRPVIMFRSLIPSGSNNRCCFMWWSMNTSTIVAASSTCNRWRSRMSAKVERNNFFLYFFRFHFQCESLDLTNVVMLEFI